MSKKIEILIEKLGNHCKENRLTIVTAESCTGGGIAFALSKSKKYSCLLERGYITYSLQAKENLLEVKPETLQIHGAVSKEVALEMAEGSLKNSIAQVSLAITGIAGEDMETEAPEGVAWVGVSTINSKSTHLKKLTFKGNRNKFINFVIEKSILFLFDTLDTK
jgi:nicotinamide-nucleotide amidase